MPSLFRFLKVIAVVAALIGAGIVALSELYVPGEREQTISIPKDQWKR
jgi:hypothetical protein